MASWLTSICAGYVLNYPVLPAVAVAADCQLPGPAVGCGLPAAGAGRQPRATALAPCQWAMAELRQSTPSLA